MPNYIVGVVEERFGTVVIHADDEEQAVERVERLVEECTSITELPGLDEEVHDKSVAVGIDPDDPDNVGIIVYEVVNDS